MQGDHPESEAPGEAGSDGARTDYGQGFSWNEDDAGSLEDVVEAAFDYRGDVTIFPRDGEALVGYLANRSISGTAGVESWIEVFPSAGGPSRRIPLKSIRGLSFSGKDVASGKSWETWLEKYAERKEALTRGEEVENIDLFPEELDGPPALEN